MSSLFESGHIIDVILAFMAAEAALLIIAKARIGYGLSPRAAASVLLPGLALMLALRAALVGNDWAIVALFLVAALIAHLIDLRLRLKTEAALAKSD